jgi:hypothetical protein
MRIDAFDFMLSCFPCLKPVTVAPAKLDEVRFDQEPQKSCAPAFAVFVVKVLDQVTKRQRLPHVFGFHRVRRIDREGARWVLWG